MGLFYPVKFREGVVRFYRETNSNLEDVAELFGIGVASLNRWLRLLRETGDLEPRPNLGGQKSKINETGEEFLKRYLKKNVDASLVDLVKVLDKEAGISTSKSAVSRALARMGITRKKRVPSPRTGYSPCRTSSSTILERYPRC